VEVLHDVLYFHPDFEAALAKVPPGSYSVW
jgi:hypothetical protein